MKSRLHNFGGRDRANQDRGNFYRLSLVALALGILSLFCGGFAAAKDRGLDKSDAELREKFSLPTISLFGQTEASFYAGAAAGAGLRDAQHVAPGQHVGNSFWIGVGVL